MRGKIGIVVGLAAGYVLGARAGRERYDQIAAGAASLWNSSVVQKQVRKAKQVGKSAAFALPSALWDGAVKVTKAATKNGTPGQKLDAVVKAGKESAEKIEDGAETTAAAVKETAEKATSAAKSASSSTRKTTSSSGTRSTAKKASS